MHLFYQLKSGIVFKFLLKILLVLFVLNLLVLSLEFYFENYTTSKITSRYTFQNYVTGMFYFDGEKNVPTYFSTLNLLFSAVLLFTISRYVKTSSSPVYYKKWYLLGCLFIWLAIDELFALHEVSAKPMRTLLQQVLQKENLGLLHFAWFIPYGLVLLGIGAYFIKFAFSLPKRTLINFLVAGCIFLMGTIGMEMASGFVVNNNLLSIYKLVTTLEETLEMVGVILFIKALIQYLESQQDLTKIVLDVAIDQPAAKETFQNSVQNPAKVTGPEEVIETKF